MIIDKIDKLGMYGAVTKEEEKMILDFCVKAEKENLQEGKTELMGEKLFAMIQIYETRSVEEGVLEAHKKYIDLQYIMEGEEIFYIEDTNACIIKEDYTPEKDFIFLEKENPAVKATLSKGMFALLYPQDAHMPCIMTDKKTVAKKIVFKIKIDQ